MPVALPFAPPAGPIDEADLQAVARTAYEASGLTQAEIAARLGVNRVSVAKALSETSGGSFVSLRVRIIEACTGYVVVGPSYRLAEREPS